MTEEELKLLQAYPLDLKIKKTELRILDAINKYGEDGLYLSFSGGKDSTVLRDIIKKMGCNITVVYCKTGLEYPELDKFACDISDVVLRPPKVFTQVITDYGYPMLTKAQAFAFYKLTHQKLTDKYRNKLLKGDEKGKSGKLSDKFHYLLNDADFEISNFCCEWIKKKALRKYGTEMGKIPIIATMAEESNNRKTRYINDGGCNAFNINYPHSNPNGFWLEQDKLKYIYKFNIEIPKPYGDIVKVKDKYYTTKEKRTGCIYCGFGLASEDPYNNRFTRMARDYHQLYDYCMRGGKYITKKKKGDFTNTLPKAMKPFIDNGYTYYTCWVPHNGLGMAHVLDVLKINYKEQIDMFNIIDKII